MKENEGKREIMVLSDSLLSGTDGRSPRTVFLRGHLTMEDLKGTPYGLSNAYVTHVMGWTGRETKIVFLNGDNKF